MLNALQQDEMVLNGDQLVHSFLMIGQSNMAGRGNLGDVNPIQNPNCYMLRNGRWHPMSEPVNIDRSIFGQVRCGISMGPSFADAYSKATGQITGLIPCADGGTWLDLWMPGGILYDNAVFTARLAQRTSVLQGILWHQGESDCQADEQLEAYPEKFLNFVSALRRDLGDVPLIVGELSENIQCGEHRAKIFNKQLRALVSQIPNCAIASSEGLQLKADGLHFDAQSQRILGRRYFEQFCTLTKISL